VNHDLLTESGKPYFPRITALCRVIIFVTMRSPARWRTNAPNAVRRALVCNPSELRSPWAISFCLQRVEAPQLAATVPDQQSGKDAENRSNQLI
jgi:hypothetical protein